MGHRALHKASNGARHATVPDFAEITKGKPEKPLVVKLKYGPNRERSLAGLRRVSKPGLRVYAKSTNLPRMAAGSSKNRPAATACHRSVPRKAAISAPGWFNRTTWCE